MVKLMLDIMWDLIVSAVIVVRLHDVIVALTLGRVRLGFAHALVFLEVIQRGLGCRHRRSAVDG